MSSFAAKAPELLDDLVEALSVVVDQVHLVDRDDEVRDAQQRRDERMAPGLLEHALARVDQDDGQVGGRRAGDHVARVLHVARRVGDDELPLRRGEVAVGDVDGDALLALGAQAVGEQRQVGALAPHPLARVLDGLELVLEDGLRVVEQAADQRGLAVVDGTGGGEAQQLSHQKYPSRLRSSMAASDARSSARVAPRSVTRVAATSSMIVVDGVGGRTRPRRCRTRRRRCGSARCAPRAPRPP